MFARLRAYARFIQQSFFMRRELSTVSRRTYKDAIDHLNSLQSNAATIEASRASGGKSALIAIPEMLDYLGRIGYKAEDLNRLNVVHITGTKGKGSTSAFTDSILRHVKPEWKIGLYTSPHLVAVRERIRINGAPISEEEFARYFFEIWDKLESNPTTADPNTSPKPGYFKYLTLLAYHIFLEKKVDATILEVGVGGRYDSTNLVPRPVVTGVTSLGLDHTTILGKTIKDIAWQKGGIYKTGVPAFTVPQPEDGLEVLENVAKEVQTSSFDIVTPISGLTDIKLGLAGTHQLSNASLALHLSHTFLTRQGAVPSGPVSLSPVYIKGLEKARWPGRCQTVPDPAYRQHTWFLDGAHTVESLECCLKWFANPAVGLRSADSRSCISRVLVFNCTSGRSGSSFLSTIHSTAIAQSKLHNYTEPSEFFFDHVIFCTNVTYADGGFKGDLTTLAIPENDLAHLKTQNELASAWSNLLPSFPKSNIHVLPSIESAVRFIQSLNGEDANKNVDVLVTGSLHLVGGVIEVADLSEAAL